MKKSLTIFSALILAATFSSCSHEGKETGNEDHGSPAPAHANVIRLAEITVPTSIFPHKITNSVEGLIASQIYEGLVRINPKDLSIMPGLAEKWEINGKTITFHLRKGVKFQSSGQIPGTDTEITAKDVLFTFNLLCSDHPDNLNFQTICENRIAGASEYHNASAKQQSGELKGFKIIDDHTFSIEVLSSPNIFLEILANPVAAIINQKAYEAKKTESHVGAGPFVLDEKSSTPTHYALYKNKNYYAKDKDGNSLPYIDSLIIDILPSSEEALNQFENGTVDIISSVPAGQVNRVVSENIQSFKNPPKFILDQAAEMITSYYAFNTNKAPFNNVKVRQAINYAIDRNRIIEKVLFGQAYGPATHGVVPPTFDYYKAKDIKGYDLDIAKAKQLLKEAGYPDGKNFPEVKVVVNSDNSVNNSVAVEIQKQLKDNLNINITFESVPNAQKFVLQNKGQADIFGDGWVADYPNPESFLSVFYGENVSRDTSKIAFPNIARYTNAAFDASYKAGRDAATREEAAKHFMKAEEALMADAPIIPLWYASNVRLMKVNLKGFQSNPLRAYDFTMVKISPDGK